VNSSVTSSACTGAPIKTWSSHIGHRACPRWLELRKRFRAALSSAGAPDLTFHELRHTFGTQMAAAGAPPRAIQEWMGHADASTTEIYSHYAADPTSGAGFAQRAFGANGTSREADVSGLPHGTYGSARDG
jgi:hypothetical protein